MPGMRKRRLACCVQAPMPGESTMAKVVLQLISDSGEVERESTLICGATARTKQVFETTVHFANARCVVGLVVEFHYRDGDVGAYDDIAVQGLWAQFTREHE